MIYVVLIYGVFMPVIVYACDPWLFGTKGKCLILGRKPRLLSYIIKGCLYDLLGNTMVESLYDCLRGAFDSDPLIRFKNFGFSFSGQKTIHVMSSVYVTIKYRNNEQNWKII